MTDHDGYFYVIALVPDMRPRRVKLGWAKDPAKRLREHRCAAPTAALIKSWPALRIWERAAIISATHDCRRISSEAFDCPDRDALIDRLSTFFESPYQHRALATSKRVDLRIPDDLHARAVQLAQAEQRNLNGLIVVLLEKAAKRL